MIARREKEGRIELCTLPLGRGQGYLLSVRSKRLVVVGEAKLLRENGWLTVSQVTASTLNPADVNCGWRAAATIFS